MNIEFMKDLPLGWQIIFTFFIILLSWFTFMLKNSTFRKMITHGITKVFHYITDNDLLMHPIFYNKRYYINQLNNINFILPEKTELFRILLTNIIKSSIDLSYECISKTDVKKLNTQTARNLMFDLIIKIIKTYEKNTREQYVAIYGRKKGLKLYGLIYESKEGFKNYHKNRVQFIIQNIEKVLLSRSKNIDDSIRTILTQIDIAIDMAILDCEDAFIDLNGRVERIINLENE